MESKNDGQGDGVCQVQQLNEFDNKFRSTLRLSKSDDNLGEQLREFNRNLMQQSRPQANNYLQEGSREDQGAPRGHQRPSALDQTTTAYYNPQDEAAVAAS